MRRAFAFLVVFLLLVGLTGGLGYFQFIVKPAMIKGFISKAPRPAPTVAVTLAKSESWAAELPSIGTFQAVQGINVAPQVGGVVSAIHFDSGQDVAMGQLLLNIDDSVEEADLRSNVAALTNADLTLQRQQKLLQGGSTAKAQRDQAQAARDQAAAAVEKSRALIAQKALRAPFAGRLGIRSVDVGQYLSPGATIVTLQELDPIFVDFPIPEQNFSLLKIGQAVDVAVDAYPGETFHGKIAAIDARVSADTRTVQVRAVLPNKKLRLLPGMFANVKVLAGAPRQVTTLPRTAITYTLSGDSVFVARAASSAPGAARAATPSRQTFVVERRSVRIGDTRNDRVAVLSGVVPGDRVVSEGQIKLQPGAIVKIDNNAALPPASKPLPKE